MRDESLNVWCVFGIIFLLINSQVVIAAPATYPQIKGSIFADGTEIPDGTPVWAMVNGNERNVSRAYILYQPENLTHWYYNTSRTTTSRYWLEIFINKSGDDPAFGAMTGDNLTFYVNGIQFSSAINASDGASTNLTVDLTSDEGTNRTWNLSLTDTVAPSAPTSLNAAELTAGLVNLTWTNASDNLWVNLSYLAYWSYSSGLNCSTGTLVGSGYNITNITHSTTANGSTVHYVVCANDTSGNVGSASAEANVTVSVLAPAQVANLTASSSNTTINLTWNPVTTNNDSSAITDLAGYYVYIWNSTSSWRESVANTTAQWGNVSLANDVQYFMNVTAYNIYGYESVHSESANATPSEAPSISSNHATSSILGELANVTITLASSAGISFLNVTVVNSTGDHISNDTNASGVVSPHTYTVNPKNWLEGNLHKIIVSVNDTSNVWSYQNYSYTYDNTSPTISSIVINDSYMSNDSYVFVNVTTSDNVAVANVTADGTSLTNYSATKWSGAVQIINSGNVSVIATDYVGMTAENSTVLYTLDNTAPSVWFVGVTDTIIQNNTNITVTVNLTEANISSVTANGVALINTTAINIVNSSWSGSVNVSNSMLNVTAMDEADNYGYNTSITFTLDDVSPVISSIVMSENLTRNNTNVTVTVNISDSDSYVLNVTVEDTILSNTSANIWVGNVTLSSEGDNITNVLAYDAAGNSVSDNSLTYAVDYTAPALTITSPANQTNFSVSNFTLNWSIVERNLATNGTWVHYSNSSINGTINATTGSVLVENLPEGMNQYLNISVYDLVGYDDNFVLYFGIDTTAPVINITNPQNSTYYSNSTVNLMWNVTENQFANASWTYKSNTTNAAQHGNVNITVDDGLNQNISITAYDTSGGSSTEYVTFNVDTTAPVIDITSPVNHTMTNATSMTFNWSVTDITFQNLTWVYNSTENGTSTTAVSSATVNLTSGLNQNITITAYDYFGNSSSQYVNFSVDWIAPVTTANYSSQSWVNANTVINLTVTDSGVGLNKTFYCINESSGCTPDIEVSNNRINLTQSGAWIFRYYSTDKAGNTEAYKTNYSYIDVTVPSTSSNYTNGTWVNETFNIALTATDAHSQVNYTNYTVDGAAYVQVNYTANASANSTVVSINTTGYHEVVYYTVDNVLNKETNQTLYAQLDMTPPKSNITALPSYKRNRTFEVNFSMYDAHSGVASVLIYYKNNTMNFTLYSSVTSFINTSLGSFNFTAPVDGNWSLYSKAVDSAGNTQNDSFINITTIVDATNPALSITYPNQSQVIEQNYTIANWSATDTNLANISYRLDARAWNYNDSTVLSANLTGMKAGKHKLIVSANDSAANVNTSNISFIINIPLDMNETLTFLDSKSEHAGKFEVYNSANWSLNYTVNKSLNLSNLTLDLGFNLNMSNGSDNITGTVFFEDFNALSATWDEYFVARGENADLTSSLATSGLTSVFVVSVINASNFIDNSSEYYVNVSVNITNQNFTYVQYCSTDAASSCRYISQCPGNNFSVGELECYTNDSTWMNIYALSFSNIIVTLDNIVATANITSPLNNSNYTLGSDINITFTIDEEVNGTVHINSSNTTNVFSSYIYSYDAKLNGTLNSSQLEGYGIFDNGQHNITLTLYDNQSNTNTISWLFNVSDYYAPNISAINVTGTSSSSSTGTATIHVYTNEYTYCWYNQSDANLNASSSNLSAYSQTDDGLSKHHTISHPYSSSGTVAGYHVTCADVLQHNMTYANFSGNFSVSVTSVQSPGGGGGSSPSTAPDANLPTPPSSWGEEASLYWDVLEAGHSSGRDLDKGIIAVSKIIINAAKTITYGNVKVVQLNRAPGVMEAMQHDVYQYLTLLTTNISSDKVSDVAIEFRISKFWINNNNPKLDSIKLFRYTNGWVELATKQIREDDDYVYYSALSPGFSYFAVGVKEFMSADEVLQCPASCDDGNACTIDACGEETGFVCTHEDIVPCCGNGICEGNEDSNICVVDCPLPKCPDSCDDNNPCTADTCGEDTGYECQHSEVEPCCGNDVCEEGETWESCPEECEEQPTFPWGWLIAILAILGAAGYIYYKYKWKPEYAKKSDEHKHHEKSKD